LPCLLYGYTVSVTIYSAQTPTTTERHAQGIALPLSTYDVARKRVILYIREVLHQRGYQNFKTALPENLCKIIGYPAQGHADAVRFIIAFSQSRVVYQAWQKRKRINRALRAQNLGSLPSDEFFASLAWKKLRYAVLQKAGARCQCCGVSAASGPQLHVDHIKPRSKYPELALEESNLQVLCADCNIGKSNLDETDWRKPSLRLVA